MAYTNAIVPRPTSRFLFRYAKMVSPVCVGLSSLSFQKKKNYPKEFFNPSIRLKIIYRETTPSCRSLEPKEKGEVVSRKNLERNSIDRIETRFSIFREGGKKLFHSNLCRKRTILANASTRHVALLLKVASCARSCRFAPFSNPEKSILCPQIQLFTRNNGTMTISCKLLTY